MAQINIGGTFHSTATGNVVANADEILDVSRNKKQSVVNEEADSALADHSERIGDLETAVGTGGSVDERIAAAVEGVAYVEPDDSSAQIADFDPQTDTVWNKEQVLSSSQKEQILSNLGLDTELALLHEQYDALTQSDIIVGSLPISGVANKIYRVPGTTDYADYMWYNSDFVLLATYDNAIDDEPTDSSNNLVKSGGVKAYVDEKVGQLGQEVDVLDYLTYNKMELESEDYTKETNRKVSYSDGFSGGASVSDNQDLYDFSIEPGKYGYIKVYMSKTISSYAAIALYSGNSEYTDYLKNDSLNGDVSTGKYYTLPIPGNAKRIKITNNRANVPTPTITLYDANFASKESLNTLKSRVDTNEENIADLQKNEKGIMSVIDIPTESLVSVNDKYPQYSNGAIANAATGSTIKTWLIPLASFQGYKTIILRTGSLDSVPACIAFYTKEETETITNLLASDYIKNASKPAPNNTVEDIVATIPNNAKTILVYSRTSKYTPDSVRLIKTEFAYKDEFEQEVEKVSNIHDTLSTIDNPLIGSPYYYHFQPNYFILDADGNKCVPSQSIADIEVAARLGFRFIEANIQKTSDGHFVCIHGVDRKFGSDEVESVNSQDISNIRFDEVTLSWIKENVVYKSDVQKYRTSIPSLEEFCEACKLNHIGLFAGTSDEDAIKICIKYMGNNLLLYNPPTSVRDYYKGWIYTWNNEEKSIDYLLERANSYGYPYMCGIGDTQASYLINNNQLDEFVRVFHNNNYLVVGAAVYSTEEMTRLLFRHGFDGSASGKEINPFFHNFEIFDLEAPNFSDNISAGASIANGVCTLPENESIACSDQFARVALGKAQLSVRFNGTIAVRFGTGGTRNITSDGNEQIIITDYFYHRDSGITFIGKSAITSVYEFVYKISKC